MLTINNTLVKERTGLYQNIVSSWRTFQSSYLSLDWTLKMVFLPFPKKILVAYASSMFHLFLHFLVCFDTTLCLSDIRWGLCVALGLEWDSITRASTSISHCCRYRVYHLHSAFLQRPIYKRMFPDEYILLLWGPHSMGAGEVGALPKESASIICLFCMICY